MEVGIISRQGDFAPLEALLTAAGHKPVAVPLAESSTHPPSIVVGFLSMRDEVPPIVSWTRRMRRDGFFAGSVVFLSFLANRAARNRWSITGSAIPGTQFVRLPMRLDQLVKVVAAQEETLSQQVLESVVRDHCCTSDDIRELAHDLANHAARLGSFLRVTSAELGVTLVASASGLGALSVVFSALGEFTLAERCRSLSRRCGAGVEPPAELGSKLTQLICDINAAIFGDAENLRWSPDGPPSDSAPRGLESVLIVDDDGYSSDAEDYLRELGYEVKVVRDTAVALEMQRDDPRAVVVSDLTFGSDPQAGNRLFQELRRLSSVPVVVAMSSDRAVSAQSVVDGFCVGPLAKTRYGAERLHAVLSTLARMRT